MSLRTTLATKRFRMQFHQVLALVLLLIVSGFVIGGHYLYELHKEVEQNHTQVLHALDERDDKIAGLTEAIKNVSKNNQLLAQEVQETKTSQAVTTQATLQTRNRLSELETDVGEEISDDESRTAVINEWADRVAQVSCRFRYNQNGDTLEATNNASATATYLSDTLYFLTNKHVVARPNFETVNCQVEIPEHDISFTVSPDNISVAQKKDFAFMRIGNAPAYESIVSTPVASCTTQPIIGTSVVILGYPSVGSQTSITATDGIVSGIEEEHYITSAKIEQGNSGGVAISVENNCFLGIPTLARVGEVESLARILPF